MLAKLQLHGSIENHKLGNTESALNGQCYVHIRLQPVAKGNGLKIPLGIIQHLSNALAMQLVQAFQLNLLMDPCAHPVGRAAPKK